jgi:hypothetical protein
MNDTPSMSVIEPGGDLVEHPGDTFVIQARVHQIGQRRAFDVFENEIGHASLIFAKVVHGDDVRMLQVGGRPSFAAKARHEFR